ncbi:MAG: helix-turn-helix transcriptional regulator [Adlercreutzia sp.]|uniref:helix-turn-helix transcriptional regulator n=1 Tax=uncultured Adlercreutzia sp. TaxID=875803 RepID=UPI00216CBB24|nr:helix-turn-helix transcriptional regulator [uncultured Adlercreutzia sp.]MCI8424829.1 helix-turn-helix transcriptional regulator [Adlercreutzia sp.]
MSIFARSIFGCGAMWTWGYLAFHTPAVLGAQGTNAQLNMCYLVSLLAVALTTTALLTAYQHLLKLLESRFFVVASCALLSISTLCMPIALPFPIGRVLIGILSGASSSILPLCWGLFLVRSGVGFAKSLLPWACVITASLVLAGHLIPPQAILAATIILPLASGLLLPSPCQISSQALRIRSVSPLKVGLSLKWFLLSILAYGVALGCFRGMLFEGISVNPKVGSMVFFAGMGTGALALALADKVLSSSLSMTTVYKSILPITTAAMLFLMLSHAAGTTIAAFLLGCGFVCFDLSAWILTTSVTVRTRISPVVSFGLLLTCSHTGMLLGALLGTWAQSHPFNSSIAPLVTVVFLVAASTATLGKLNVLGLENGPTQAASPSQPSSAASASPLDALSERFGLTPRESEILALLLAGRTRNRIEQELVLSKSTVKTHVRHIYEKIGVHSQQELLDLADESRREKR